MRRALRAVISVVYCVLVLSYAAPSWAQDSTQDNNNTLTSFTWVMTGVLGMAGGFVLGSLIFSSVGVGAKTLNKKEQTLLLEDYLNNHPSALLEATSWVSGPAAQEVAKICGARDVIQRRAIGERLRFYRAEIVDLLDQTYEPLRGHKLWRLSCGDGEVAVEQGVIRR